MDAREMRGMEIAATVQLRRDTYCWRVPSQSGPGEYKVELDYDEATDTTTPYGCTCPDYELRGQPCKHVFAVEYTIRRQRSSEGGDVVTEQVKVTYTQNWTAYNAAQCEEKERFMPMLADLCSTLSTPYKGNGRPPLPLSDMAFAAVMRIYSGLSARRFDSDVREAKSKGLTASTPCFNSVLGYLRDPKMTPALRRLVELSALPLADIETDFAMDATGFTTTRFERWYDHKWGKERSRQEWIKLHAMCGVRTNIVTAVEITDGHANDAPYLVPTLATTAENFTIRKVSADKGYTSKRNMQAVADLGGTPYIPFKASPTKGPVPSRHDPYADVFAPSPRASAWDRMYHFFQYQRDTFLTHYHQRSNVECTFSMIKRKFGDSLRSKSEVGQENEVLAKVVAHNLCVLIACIHEIGLDVPGFGNRERCGLAS